MEGTSDNVLAVSSPEQETGSQDRSQLCTSTLHNTVLPGDLVIGLTIQLPPFVPVIRSTRTKVQSSSYNITCNL